MEDPEATAELGLQQRRDHQESMVALTSSSSSEYSSENEEEEDDQDQGSGDDADEAGLAKAIREKGELHLLVIF